MTVSFKIPTVLVIGRVGNELAVWSIDGTTATLGNVPGIEMVNELNVERQVMGHMALASFGQYVIKAIDLGSRYGSYTLNDNIFVKIPSKNNADFKKYNDWFTIRNTFILIGDPRSTNAANHYPLICPYRVGDTLFINTGFISADSIKVVLTLLDLLRNNPGNGYLNTACMCRIPSMPLEIALISSDEYLLVRTYLNESQVITSSKYLVLLTKGGNVISKYVINEEPINTVINVLNEMRKY